LLLIGITGQLIKDINQNDFSKQKTILLVGLKNDFISRFEKACWIILLVGLKKRAGLLALKFCFV